MVWLVRLIMRHSKLITGYKLICNLMLRHSVPPQFQSHSCDEGSTLSTPYGVATFDPEQLRPRRSQQEADGDVAWESEREPTPEGATHQCSACIDSSGSFTVICGIIYNAAASKHFQGSP